MSSGKGACISNILGGVLGPASVPLDKTPNPIACQVGYHHPHEQTTKIHLLAKYGSSTLGPGVGQIYLLAVRTKFNPINSSKQIHLLAGNMMGVPIGCNTEKVHQIHLLLLGAKDVGV